MGELGHLLTLAAYQLVLPFTQEAWRQLEYTHALTGCHEQHQLAAYTHFNGHMTVAKSPL